MREEHSLKVEMPIAGVTSVLERRPRITATFKPSSEAAISDGASSTSRSTVEDNNFLEDEIKRG